MKKQDSVTIAELIKEFGTNVKDFYFSDHRGQWILSYHVGNDDEFDSFDELYDFIKNEGRD